MMIWYDMIWHDMIWYDMTIWWYDLSLSSALQVSSSESSGGSHPLLRRRRSSQLFSSFVFSPAGAAFAEEVEDSVQVLPALFQGVLRPVDRVHVRQLLPLPDLLGRQIKSASLCEGSTSLPAARTSRLPQLARIRLGSQEWLNREATTWELLSSWGVHS